MNKKCKLCDEKYNFDSIFIKERSNNFTIAIVGGNEKVNENDRFKYCPVCGEKLTKENFDNNE